MISRLVRSLIHTHPTQKPRQTELDGNSEQAGMKTVTTSHYTYPRGQGDAAVVHDELIKSVTFQVDSEADIADMKSTVSWAFMHSDHGLLSEGEVSELATEIASTRHESNKLSILEKRVFNKQRMRSLRAQLRESASNL